jgi:hypothetical protein
MSRYMVVWRFVGSDGPPRASLVVASDKKHAEEMVWRYHVEPSDLRRKIQFISIEQQGDDDEGSHA